MVHCSGSKSSIQLQTSNKSLLLSTALREWWMIIIFKLSQNCRRVKLAALALGRGVCLFVVFTIDVTSNVTSSNLRLIELDLTKRNPNPRLGAIESNTIELSQNILSNRTFDWVWLRAWMAWWLKNNGRLWIHDDIDWSIDRLFDWVRLGSISWQIKRNRILTNLCWIIELIERSYSIKFYKVRSS